MNDTQLTEAVLSAPKQDGDRNQLTFGNAPDIEFNHGDCQTGRSLLTGRKDSLTNLLNRSACEQNIKDYLAGPGRSGNHAVMIIDVDHFRNINTQLGHLFGDAILIHFAAKLQKLTGPDNLSARIGGDEFLIFIKNCSDYQIHHMAADICQILLNILPAQQRSYSISGSIGISRYPQDADSYAALFQKADTALYHAKLSGHSCYKFFHQIPPSQAAPGLLNHYQDAEPHVERKYANVLLVTNIIELLFASRDFDSTLHLILSMLGNYYRVNSACLVENRIDENYCGITYLWLEDDSDTRMDNLKVMSEDIFFRHRDLYDEDGLFCCYDLSSMDTVDKGLKERLHNSGLASSLQCAVTDNDVFYGFITLNVFDTQRVWSDEDINSFLLISKSLGAYLVKLRAQQRNDHYASMDSLTRSWNISKFTEEAGHYLSLPHKESASILTVDIRNFRFFNERWGYARGNDILTAFSTALSCSLEAGEMSARIAGDQFILLLHYKDTESFYKRVNTMLSQVEIISLPNGQIYKLTIIAGAYLISEADTPLTTMIDRANLARKQGKNSHKSTLIPYSSHMEKSMLMEKYIENNMEYGLNNGQFFVVYQPKISFTSGRIVGAEALIRWKNAEGQIIYPDEFIPVFEKNGFIVEIDLFVLEQVCRQLKIWQEQGWNLTVAVNFSRMHVLHQNSLLRILQILDTWQIKPENIEIEVTESAFIQNSEELSLYVETLRNNGFKIAMDDFGSGYSSLTLLKDLPIDVLKLDKEFLHSDQLTQKGRIVLNNTVQMAHQLGMSIVAEGVETSEQADFLREIGCETAQGYLYARPLYVKDFEASYMAAIATT